MTKPNILAAVAFAGLLALAGCEQPPAQVVGEATPDAVTREAAARPPVTLPPAIADAKTYRCRDKSAIQVNFMADRVTANVRAADQLIAAPIVLTAPAAGQPYVAEGYSLSGDGDEVSYTSPTAPSQVCKA